MKKLSLRLVAFALALIMAFSMFACDNSGSGENQNQGGSGGSQTSGGPDSAYEGGVMPDAPTVVECADTDGEIKNIILIIGDGMGEAQLDAAELIYGSEYDFRYDFDKFYSDTNSLNEKTGKATEVTDSAASATAMATGYLTYNKYTGINKDLKKLTTLLDIAKLAGKATGMVTTDELVGATPSAFTAHTMNRNLEHEVVKSQIQSGVDLLIGQYSARYVEYEERIKEKYNYFDSYDRSAILSKREEDTLLHCEIETEADSSVSLAELAMLAIDYLSADSDGFVLVIEQAHIDKYCHDMNLAGAVSAAQSLNETIEAVMEFAMDSADTAVIVTADHETRGLVVSEDEDEYSRTIETEDGSVISYEFTATYHTDTLVPVYVWGFDAHPERCTTFKSKEKIKNSDIYHFIVDLIENS